MTKLFAQPYDISAHGFFFETADEYKAQAEKLRNSSGLPVEEFEIQFIDGEKIDAALFEALSVHQGDIAGFLEAVDDWSKDAKIKAIIAVGDVGYDFNLGTDNPDKFEVDLYELDSMRDLAMQFVEDGLFGVIPDRLKNYLNYDAIARDLSMDYSEIKIDGTNYIYRCS